MEKLIINVEGEYEYIDCEEKVIDVIKRKLGAEFGKLTEKIIRKLVKDASYTKQALNTDLRGYEMSLDNYNTVIRDSEERLEELQEYILNAKKIDRNKIYQSLNKVIKDLKSN